MRAFVRACVRACTFPTHQRLASGAEAVELRIRRCFFACTRPSHLLSPFLAPAARRLGSFGLTLTCHSSVLLSARLIQKWSKSRAGERGDGRTESNDERGDERARQRGSFNFCSIRQIMVDVAVVAAAHGRHIRLREKLLSEHPSLRSGERAPAPLPLNGRSLRDHELWQRFGPKSEVASTSTAVAGVEEAKEEDDEWTKHRRRVEAAFGPAYVGARVRLRRA